MSVWGLTVWKKLTFPSLRREGGFTLLQLSILIVMLVALSIFAAVNIWDSINNYRLQSSLAALIADMRYAQHLATTHSGWYGVRFQTTPTNTYVVYVTDGTTDTPVMRPQDPSQPLQINVESEFGGVEIATVNIDNGAQVEFNPRGTPYTDKNTSPIMADGLIVLRMGSRQQVINIVKNTGRVETP